MRYLSRNKVYEKVNADRDAKKIYVFCEGQGTEIKYFNYFKGFSSNIDIIPIPNDDGKSDPVKLKENAQLLFFGNASENILPKFNLSIIDGDEVWFVIDTDRWNEGDKIQKLKDFCLENNQKCINWYVVQSNPSFELWLFYHLNDAKPIDNDVSMFNSFKEYVNDKIQGGFDPRSMPVELEIAIRNSIANFVETINNQPDLYSTNVYLLGNTILPFIKQQLEMCKQRIQDHNNSTT